MKRPTITILAIAVVLVAAVGLSTGAGLWSDGPAYAAASQPVAAATPQPVAGVRCTAADSSRIASLLSEASKLPVTTNLTMFFARKFIGIPYVGKTLETANGDEPLIVNLRQLDCTTYVETVAALTLCARRSLYTVNDYFTMLTTLRYRNGCRNGYTSRLHYFSDWIADNCRRQMVEEVVLDETGDTRETAISVDYMSKHPQAYSALKLHPDMVPDIRRQEQQLSKLTCHYLPKAAIGNTPMLRKLINDGDIIAITTSKAGLDIAHLGFAVWQANGLHLLNASQKRKRVVEEPMTLSKYLEQHPTFTGIRVIRIKS